MTAFVGALVAALAGCATQTQKPAQPPGVPPSPASVSRDNPGGDAADPVRAALERLLAEPWGKRNDRFQTLRVHLPDSKHWRRVRLWGYPTRASFRYGDEHIAVATVYYQKAEGADDPQSCLEQFIAYGTPVAKKFDVKVDREKNFLGVQNVDGAERPLAFRLMDGAIDSLLASDEYVGGVAAYRSWPGTCLVQGFAVVATEHRELATRVLDRWVKEGAALLGWERRVTEAPAFDAR